MSAFQPAALYGLFMPRAVPDSCQKEADVQILNTLMHVLEDDGLSWELDANVKKLVQCFCDLHRPFENSCMPSMPDAGSLLDSLQDVKTGGYWATWVKAQNAILFIERTEVDFAQVAAWPVQPSAARVLELDPGFVLVPEVATMVPWNVLAAEPFAARIADLSRNAIPEALPMNGDIVETFEVPSSTYVLDYLLPALGGDSADLSVPWQCVGMKVRDESRGKQWRRPAVWLALKALLRLGCERAQHRNGLAVYKRFVLRVLTAALYYCDDSFGVEAARKLARRMKKLELKGIQNDLLPSVHEAVVAVMEPISKAWQTQCDQPRPSILNPKRLTFTEDIHHSLVGSRPRLNSMLVDLAPNSVVKPKEPTCITRADKHSSFADHLARLNDPQCRDHDDVVTALFDIECRIMECWTQWQSTGCRPMSARDMLDALPLLREYIKVASDGYKNDAESLSRMVLFAVTLVLLVDRNACQEHSLLKDHCVGLDDSMLTYLLLELKVDNQLLCSLERYLASRRYGQRARHTSITHPGVHDCAFAVRFANASPEMCDTHRILMQQCKENEKAKARELADKQEQHRSLLAQAGSRTCTYETRYDRYGCSYEQHSSYCYKCSLQQQARNINMNFYIRLLPTELDQQMAIIFDLQIPPALSCLRDSLATLADLLSKDFTTKADTKGMWRSDGCLSTWLSKEQVEPRIQLAYLCNPPLWRAQHVLAHDSFVVDNAHDLVLSDSTVSQALAESPTWSAEELVRIITPDVRYQALQGSIDSWLQPENNAIARKCDAHPDLSLREFEVYGSMREGVRLQILRLIRALAQQSLSFEREGVVDLLTALLMQVGPAGQFDHQDSIRDAILPDSGAWSVGRAIQSARDFFGKPAHDQPWRRQAHEILGVQSICNDLCCHASELLVQQSDNWSRHLVLLAIVNIGRCVLQHAPDTTAASKLLMDCRQIAGEWIKKVRAVISQSEDEAAQQLRLKLVDIVCASTLTYEVDRLDLLTINVEQVAAFLQLRSVLSDNILLGKLQRANMDPRRASLLTKVLRTTLRLEEALHVEVQHSDALTRFIELHWSDAKSGECGPWTVYPNPAQRWFWSRFCGPAGDSILQIDVLRGSFLVDGAPVGRLPKDVTAHADYVRLFGSSLFEVQPASGGGWRTSSRVRGGMFTFQWRPDPDMPLVIVEERVSEEGTSITAVLVPEKNFENDVPDALVDECSHWLVKQGGIAEVFFRPREYDHPGFELGCCKKGATFILDLQTNLMVDTVLGRHLVDVRSTTFTELYNNVFTLLSPRGQVHVFHAQSQSTVILPKLHGIQFHVEDQGKVRSHEFGGYVAPDQQFGTLIGLCHGVLLEDVACRKTLLMPHARVTREPQTHQVKISIDDLRNPPLFVYSVRDDLQELHGQKDRLAWLYLAKLHALTAGVLPDPFLGRSGTAQALHLLQSGRCRGNLSSQSGWTSSSAKQTLIEIAQCSPRRSHFRNLCEVSDLVGHCLPPLCAHDGFAFAADLILQEATQARRLACQEPDKKEPGDENPLEDMVGSLSKRSYFRSRDLYSSDARLSEEFEEAAFGATCTATVVLPNYIASTRRQSYEDLRLVAMPAQLHRPVRSSASLDSLLLSKDLTMLRGHLGEEWQHMSLLQWRDLMEPLAEDPKGSWFPHAWINMYEIAQKVSFSQTDVHVGTKGWNMLTQQGPEVNHESMMRFTFMLAFFAQRDARLVEHMQQFVTIALHPAHFNGINPPKYPSYKRPAEAVYKASDVEAVINRFLDEFHERPPGPPRSSYGRAQYDRERAAYFSRKEIHADECRTSKKWFLDNATAAFSSGRILSVAECQKPRVTHPKTCAQELEALFVRWRRARELHDFIEQVGQKLKSLQPSCQPSDWIDTRMESLMPSPSLVQPEVFWLPTPLPNDVAIDSETQELWSLGRFPFDRVHGHGFAYNPPPRQSPPLPIMCNDEAAHLTKALINPLRRSWQRAHEIDNALPGDVNVEAEYFSPYLQTLLEKRLAAWKQLELAMQPPEEDWTGMSLKQSHLWPAVAPNTLVPQLGSSRFSEAWATQIGVFAVLLRHHQQVRRCLRYIHDGDKVQLDKEMATLGCEGWKPSEHPEWLLLEVDNDFCIRKQQAEVATRIMNAEEGNKLLQLIMGAGKTAVIVPMVIASLANGKRCVRVTVMSSLCSTNAADWQLKLGGFLGRQVFSLVCRRDLHVEQHSGEIMQVLQHIQSHGHVIVTVPEHRLSLENKVMELAWKGQVDTSMKLQAVLDFFERSGRDVLDESDELLHAKYQLIYTLGAPLELDGGPMRWVVGSAILSSVAHHAKDLQETFGHDSIELKAKNELDCCGFPDVRLLTKAKESGGAYEHLCKLIVDDILSGRHPQLQVQLRGEEADLWRRTALQAKCDDQPWSLLSPILQPLALAVRGLLAHEVLFLALHKRWRVEYGAHPRGRRRMAVPYRAKDVAAERTEFGHQDVAMLLSTLHYYRCGLSRPQLREAFNRLTRRSESAQEAGYAAWVHGVPQLPETLRSWKGLNLDDFEHFEDLIFPWLRYNMRVIDFWLDQVTYPVEAKQFKTKIVSTAWDLCRKAPCITTGFSGTDDSRLLLPLTISQHNLPTLEHTNGLVLKNLSRTENDHYTHMPPSALGQDLLEKVGQNSDIDVLLDAGALVLELSNEDVALKWLHMRTDREAAIYYCEDCQMVVTRDGMTMPLAVSPYERRLDRCLLYLDDVHTRGSDFRIPLGRCAAVTLGKGMQKDKLAQACMRMRQLGQGHSVRFYASFEAELQIEPWRQHLLQQKEQTLKHVPAILSWCLNNTVRSICDNMQYFASQGASQLRKLHARIAFKDCQQKRADMCAEEEILELSVLYGHGRTLVPIPDIVQVCLNSILQRLDAKSEVVNNMSKGIQRHVNRYCADVSRQSALLDEEQERELEEELEEEREVERPPPAEPCTPHVSPGLVDFARGLQLNEGLFLPLQAALQCTSFSCLLTCNWDTSVFVTPDFARTVTDRGDHDAFLRPVMWMLKASCKTVIMSNFEAESLAAFFHFPKAGRPALCLIAPVVRPSQNPLLPSWPHADDPTIVLHIFAGSIHGDKEYIDKLRHFLGLCEPRPACPAWRNLFENREAICRDCFVLPQFRDEVEKALGLSLGRSFATSPVLLLRRLYFARHLGDELASSPVGQQVLQAADISNQVS